MKNPFYLLFLFLLILAACSDEDKTPTQPGNSIDEFFLEEARNFLTEHSYEIDINEFNSLNSIPDSVIENAKIILTGENHGVKMNVNLKLAYIKYLHSKFGIKNIILELGYSTGKYLQNYIETGDEKILQHIFEYLEGTAYYSKEQFDFWKQIRLYNISIPEEEKLVLYGIDVEHQYINAVTYLESLLPDEDPPAEIENLINEIKEIVEQRNFNRTQIGELAKNIETDLITRETYYLQYLGLQKTIDFQLVCRGITKGIEWNDYYQNNYEAKYNFRDGFMYETFRLLTHGKENEKFYGQFGINHILQSKIIGVDWFAARLNSSSFYSNKIISIPYYYDKCSYMFYITGDYTEGYLSTINNFGFLIGLDKGNLTFFHLVGNNSPFSNESYLQYYADDGENPTGFTQVITDYYQYAILVQNSEAQHPYK